MKFETSIQDVNAKEIAKPQYHPELKHDECQKDFTCQIMLQRLQVQDQVTANSC